MLNRLLRPSQARLRSTIQVRLVVSMLDSSLAMAQQQPQNVSGTACGPAPKQGAVDLCWAKPEVKAVGRDRHTGKLVWPLLGVLLSHQIALRISNLV